MSAAALLLLFVFGHPAPAGAGDAPRLPPPAVSATLPSESRPAKKPSSPRFVAVRAAPAAVPGVKGLMARRKAVHARIVAVRGELKRIDDRISRARNDAERRELSRRRLVVQRRLERLFRRLFSLRSRPIPGQGSPGR